MQLHSFEDELVKTAITAKILAALRHPLNAGSRAMAEDALRSGIRKYVNAPVRKGLEKARVPQAVGKVVETATKDIPHTPRMIMKGRNTAERKALGEKFGRKAVDIYSDNPELLPVLLAPVPGVTETYLAGKHLVKKVLRVPKGK